jgi:hypothetical protein
MLISSSHCFRDLGVRSDVKDILCQSYNSAWLALGMELVTGRTCGPCLEDNTYTLRFFIENVRTPFSTRS